jgi:hypothetical protein
MVFQASLFNEYVLKIEGDRITAIETIRHMRELENALRRRRDDVFLSIRTENEKNVLIGTGVGRAELEGQCKQFFGMKSFSLIE